MIKIIVEGKKYDGFEDNYYAEIDGEAELSQVLKAFCRAMIVQTYRPTLGVLKGAIEKLEDEGFKEDDLIC